MTRHHVDHTDPLKLDWIRNPDIEAMIEQRVAERAQSQAFQWRLRLMIIETFIMGTWSSPEAWCLAAPGSRFCAPGPSLQRPVLPAAFC
ncbi:hypothetical protein [Novosphingobium sp. SG707]|uniref:hypothetical protein n=1 Tax=Novosphingobium sp. SG707 TaxID=2586996 RepID=UPI00184A3B7F|nr:hypothetical protein [Novosphingobium sp. SG707]